MSDKVEPHAWMVSCPKGHEYDYMVFWEEQGAQDEAAIFDECEDVPDGTYQVEPLYRLEDAAKAERRECANAAGHVMNTFYASTDFRNGALAAKKAIERRGCPCASGSPARRK